MTRSRRDSDLWAGLWTGARAALALVIVAAVVAQAISTFTTAAADGRHLPTTVANFFSLFTILSNCATAAVLMWAAIRLVAERGRRRVDPRSLATALVCVSTYMLITGVVYNVLLGEVSIGPDTVGWANEVMHVWAPLFLLVDLFVGPERRSLPWSSGALALVFPLAWIAYTLVRAPFITAPTSGASAWYPYPFLDPSGSGGWPSVVLYIVGIASAIIAVAFLAVWVGRRTARRMPADA